MRPVASPAPVRALDLALKRALNLARNLGLTLGPGRHALRHLTSSRLEVLAFDA